MIHDFYGNNHDTTERTLREQAEARRAADRRLFEAMRQAEDTAFYARPEWQPEPSIEDDHAWLRGFMGGY